jgi:ribosomal protein L34E
MPKVTDATLSKLSKSQRRPERPFGGNLCSSCSRRELKRRLFESVQ